jgi:DivIVA domain-containing protein
MSNGFEMDTRFRRTRLRAGYSTEEVDAFIAELEIALFSPEPRVSACDVARQRFTEVRRFGYDMQDVDTCLEKAEHLLSEAEDRRDPHPFRSDLINR